jgi:hypothetical protein
MSFEWVSFFECVDCGTTGRSDAIRYDGLGYAVCPACGCNHGPLTGARFDERGHAVSAGR